MKRFVCIFLSAMLFSNIVTASAEDISAKAAIVIDGVTGEVLYSLNSNERLPMASTTKIMTSLILCELCNNLNDEVVVTREMATVEGSSMGLLEGDRVSYHDLLYGMMLASGNDAANTVAIAVAGSVSKFADIMNERAKQMGLKDTHFVTPSGLDSEEHYTTAYELALIAKEAMSNPYFSEAASAETACLCYGNPPYKRTLKNHNKLLKMYDDIVGVKTGFTKKSGRCLVSASKKDNKFVVAVTLNDGNDWADHRKLLDLGISLIESKEFSASEKTFSVHSVSGDDISVEVPSADINVTENSKITYKINVPHFLYPPVNSGDEVGKVYYYCNENEVCAKPLVSNADLKNENDKLALFKEIFLTVISSF